jgi:hypothetical protein
MMTLPPGSGKRGNMFTSHDYNSALGDLEGYNPNIHKAHPQSLVYRVWEYLKLRRLQQQFEERHRERDTGSLWEEWHSGGVGR